MLAIGAIQALRKRGLQVPSDLSVVCFDDFGYTDVLNPFLTVASQPAYQFGALGMQLLIERIEGESTQEHRKMILPSELLIRSSTQALT